MSEISEGQPGPREEVSLEEIRKLCLDGLGFVMYVSVLTPERSDNGANVIKSFYQRSHFSFEDTRNAIKGFEKAFREDIESI